MANNQSQEEHFDERQSSMAYGNVKPKGRGEEGLTSAYQCVWLLSYVASAISRNPEVAHVY